MPRRLSGWLLISEAYLCSVREAYTGGGGGRCPPKPSLASLPGQGTDGSPRVHCHGGQPQDKALPSGCECQRLAVGGPGPRSPPTLAGGVAGAPGDLGNSRAPEEMSFSCKAPTLLRR